jgi:hypothetical protein
VLFGRASPRDVVDRRRVRPRRSAQGYDGDEAGSCERVDRGDVECDGGGPGVAPHRSEVDGHRGAGPEPRIPPTPSRVSTTRVGPIGVSRRLPVRPSHPVTSTRTSVSVEGPHADLRPTVDSAAIVVLATVCPATKLSVELFGTRSEHGYTVTKPGAAGLTAVTLTTAAVASAGTDARSPTWTIT